MNGFCKKSTDFGYAFLVMRMDHEFSNPGALGIEAASFWSEAEKDIAKSPTRSGTPKLAISYQLSES